MVRDTASFYFYKGLPYGSQAAYNPGNVIINGGYGIFQVPARYHNRQIFGLPYRYLFETCWDHLRHPLANIEGYGWKRFLTTEVLPGSPFNRKSGQFIPNYFLHGIGAGLHYRATAEWYQYHGFPRPRLWSLASMAVYHFLTEAVENGGSREVSVDGIADIYIFNPLGIILFSCDPVCRFFSRTLSLSEWSLQPVYNARTGNLENMGQFYVVRYPLNRERDIEAMVHFGLHGMVGLSKRLSRGRCLSGTLGLMVEDLVRVDQELQGRALTAELTWSGGVFYDRSNSLLASLMVSGLPQNRLRLNLYPGVLGVGRFRPGFFAAWGDEEITWGLTWQAVPLGLGWGAPP